jgi:predicted Zn-dependent protease
MKNKICIIFLTIIFTGVLFSCKSLTAAADVSADIVGMINENAGNAISTSARAIGTAAEEINPEQEYYIGRAVAANILDSYTLYTENQELTAYLNNICAAITINSPRPDIYNGYHVALLDSNEINAFATSGGHIFVTRGLVNAAKSEDALAGVIAHEVAHIQLKHSIKAIKNIRIVQALLVTGTSAVGAATGKDVKELTDVMNESVGEIVHTLINSGYSQTQEFEADNAALFFMASAGYNPSGLIEMLKSLSVVQTAGVGFGKTHPSPARRITNAKISVKKYKVTDTSASRNARFAVEVK